MENIDRWSSNSKPEIHLIVYIPHTSEQGWKISIDGVVIVNQIR